jgi:hypothetical protein
MKATIAWWALSQSHQTIDTLRDYLQNEGVVPWSEIEGMVLKFWFSERKTNRWGAVINWLTNITKQNPDALDLAKRNGIERALDLSIWLDMYKPELRFS